MISGKRMAEVEDNSNEMEVDSKVSKRPRFTVKKWNAVALWAWDIVVDNCAICRNHIMDLCTQLTRN